MNMNWNSAGTVRDALTDGHREAWDRLLQQTLENERPVAVSVVGAFSMGKSTMLNTLLGKPGLLPLSLEETTALPTFIEHGPVAYRHQHEDGTVEDIPFAEFQRRAAQGSSGYLSAFEPADWLKGVIVVDLPGLGGNDPARGELTRAQIEAADAIIYMLANRGPTAEDLPLLRQVKDTRRPCLVLVGRWDIVEERVAKGEQRPDFADWAASIAGSTGLDTQLVPFDKNGRGKDRVVEFLRGLVAERGSIRQRRFDAVAPSIIDGAIRQMASEAAALAARTEREIGEMREQVTARRHALRSLKADQQSRASDARADACRRLREATDEVRAGLRASAEREVAALDGDVTDAEWDRVRDALSEAGRRALTDLAARASSICREAGDASSLVEEWPALNLRLPPIVEAETDDWTGAARVEEIQQRILQLAQANAGASSALVPAGTANGHAAERARLKELLEQRAAIENAEIPMTAIEIPGSGFGASIGRFLGTVADFGMMLMNPGTVGAKFGSLVGQGAKAAKVAKQVTSVVKVAQNAQKNSMLAQGVRKQTHGYKAAQTVSVLEKLSLGYWGERLGAMFDTPPSIVLQADPAVVEERERLLAASDVEVSDCRRRLRAVEEELHEAKLTEYMATRRREEAAELQRLLDALEAARVAAEQRAAASAKAERARQIRVWGEQLVEQALTSLSMRAHGLEKRLVQALRAYWDGEVARIVAEEERAAADLESRLGGPVEARRTRVAEVEQRIVVLRQAAGIPATTCT